MSGFGKSAEPSVPYFLGDYVFELKNLLDKYDIEKLYLVGHSFGGRVAIKFAYLYQNEYSSFKLCLIDSAGVIPRRGLRYYFKILRYKCLKHKSNSSFKAKEKMKKMGSSDYKKLSPTMKKTFVNIVNEDLLPYAKFISVDTFIIWGKYDKDTKLYMAKKLHRAIKNSELFILDNAGHFSFLDNKLDFLILLDTFIKN